MFPNPRDYAECERAGGEGLTWIQESRVLRPPAPPRPTPILSGGSRRRLRSVPCPHPAARTTARRGGSAVLLGLPNEIAVDILSRVPADSLRCELKLVSRAWRYFIAGPFHRKSLPQTLEGFFHGCGDDNYGRFAGLFGRRSSLPEVVVDPSFSFLTNKLPWVERMALIDSCNGLLLFATYARNPDGGFGYVACSPSTEELAFVPSPSGSPPPVTFYRDGASSTGKDVHSRL